MVYFKHAYKTIQLQIYNVLMETYRDSDPAGGIDLTDDLFFPFGLTSFLGAAVNGTKIVKQI